MIDFASEILKRRDAARLSQEQLAQAADVSRATIQNAESGKNISIKAARKIATALAWSPESAVPLARKGAAIVTIRGAVAQRLRDAAGSAGVPVDEYLDGLLPKQRKGR